MLRALAELFPRKPLQSCWERLELAQLGGLWSSHGEPGLSLGKERMQLQPN